MVQFSDLSLFIFKKTLIIKYNRSGREIMTNLDILFNLIKSSLKNEKLDFNSQDELGLYRLIYETGLTALIFNSLKEDSFINEKLYQKLKSINYSFVIKDSIQQEIIKEINEAFNKNKIDHIFLKGTHIKNTYPKTYQRGMGDIDVLIRKDDFNKGIDILKELNYKLESTSFHHHVFKTYNNESVELHQNITSIVEYDNKDFLSNVWGYTYKDKDYLYKLNNEFEYVYILTHLVRHLRSSGIGLRSILDVYFYKSYYKDEIDYNVVSKMLEETNLITFDIKINKLLDHIFKDTLLNDDDFKALSYIIDSGIHGSGTKHDYYIVKKTYETKVLKKSRFNFFFREIFPKRNSIEESYPYLKSYPFLLPWAWFVRLFKKIIKTPKDILNRLRVIKKDKKEDKLNEVYNYFKI